MAMSKTDAIQGAVYAALGCTTIDRRSPRRLDEAAKQIARFVEDAIARYDRENCEHPRKSGLGSVGSDGSSTWSWHCPDCGASASSGDNNTGSQKALNRG